MSAPSRAREAEYGGLAGMMEEHDQLHEEVEGLRPRAALFDEWCVTDAKARAARAAWRLVAFSNPGVRTDHTSGKHSWTDTCFLAAAADIPKHVFNLAEFSELCGFPGLPWKTWVIREMLPTVHLGGCPRYGKHAGLPRVPVLRGRLQHSVLSPVLARRRPCRWRRRRVGI